MDPINKRLRAEAAALRASVEAHRVGSTKGGTNGAKGARFAIHVTPPSNELDTEYPEGTERPTMPYELSATVAPSSGKLVLTWPKSEPRLLSMTKRVLKHNKEEFKMTIPKPDAKLKNRPGSFKTLTEKGWLIEVKDEMHKTDVDDQ